MSETLWFQSLIPTCPTFWQKKEISHQPNGAFALKEFERNQGEVSERQKGHSLENGKALNLKQTPVNSLTKGQVNLAYEYDTTISDSDSGTGCDTSVTEESRQEDMERGTANVLSTHSIILDISTAGFVDTVTVKTLKNVCG